MTQERALILVDGSNFYFKLRDLKLHQLLTFDFSSFADSLIGKNRLVSAIYYVGKVRTDGTEKTQQQFNKQRKLLARLKKHQFTYSLGYLLKSGGKLHEKGVTCRSRLICSLQHTRTLQIVFTLCPQIPT